MKKPMMMPYSTATAADSVGVNTPDRVPPMMMMGIIRALKPLVTALPISRGVALG